VIARGLPIKAPPRNASKPTPVVAAAAADGDENCVLLFACLFVNVWLLMNVL
jgi:hypothetical protein